MKFFLLVIFFLGCDGVSLRTVESTGEVKAVRSQIQFSSEGVGALFNASTPEGLLVKSDSLSSTIEGATYQIGPLEERFTIDRQETTTSPGEISIIFDLDKFSFPMALRGEKNGTKICRYAIAGDSIDIRATVEVRNDTGVPRLTIIDFTTPTISEFTISDIGNCEFDFDTSQLLPIVKTYLENAITDACTLVFENSPTQLLGLAQGATALTKESGGRLVVEQLLSPNGAAIGDNGVSIKLDVGVSSKRDRCVPPLQYVAQSDSTSQGLANLEEDIGLAFSKSFLQDLFSSSVLAGLFCWEGVPVVLNQTKLEEIGLDFLRLSSSLSVRFQPASLPVLSFENDGLIRIEWPLFTVDTYAKIFGARQRVILVSGSLDLRLRPRTNQNSVNFEIESMTVATSDVATKWSSQIFTSPELDQWTSRLILLSFEERFMVPSPLQPQVGVTFDGVKSTTTDMVLLYSVD